MKDLTVNTKFHLANLKTQDNRREAWKRLPEEVRKELLRKCYWDIMKNDLTEKAYETYAEWFDEVYIGSKEEKLDYDHPNGKN